LDIDPPEGPGRPGPFFFDTIFRTCLSSGKSLLYEHYAVNTFGGTMDNNEHSMSEDTSRFLQLIAMFQVAAMQQLGKLPNPLTNEIERDLQQAKASIDMLETIKKKTEGNLSDAETEFFDKILFELRMNYVDESDRAKTEDEGDEEDKEDNESADEGDTETNSK
jgi:hypothetical protein